VKGLTARQDPCHDVAVDAGIADDIISYMLGLEADYDLRLTSIESKVLATYDVLIDIWATARRTIFGGCRKQHFITSRYIV
jgi:hypothetical protein